MVCNYLPRLAATEEEVEVISSSRAHSLFFALRNNFAVIWRRGAVQGIFPLLLVSTYKSLSSTAATAFFVSVAHFLLEEEEEARITGLDAVSFGTDERLTKFAKSQRAVLLLSRIQRNKKKKKMVIEISIFRQGTGNFHYQAEPRRIRILRNK